MLHTHFLLWERIPHRQKYTVMIDVCQPDIFTSNENREPRLSVRFSKKGARFPSYRPMKEVELV
jgi:hypothetical protein